MKVRTVTCPSCASPVTWTRESNYRPFCSERCKTMDLGAWATEKYRVAKAEDEPDGESGGQDNAELR